jgi:hypothetical protein
MPETFCEAEFEGDGLINLMEEISWHPSIQAVAWSLLAACSNVYSETRSKRAVQRDLKNVEFD